MPGDANLPAVVVDRDRLRQALLNLVRNGIDAAGEGGTVRLDVKPAPTGGLDVVVSDNGPGVPLTQREQIFAPFFTTRTDGTGLGLVVAREIAREHGVVTSSSTTATSAAPRSSFTCRCGRDFSSLDCSLA